MMMQSDTIEQIAHHSLLDLHDTLMEITGNDFEVLGTIRSPLILNHTVYILQPKYYLGVNQICIVDDHGNIKMLIEHITDKFHRFIEAEGITIDNYGVAYDIARSIIRFILPEISPHPLFFLDELMCNSYDDLTNKGIRNEVRYYDDLLDKFIYFEYIKKFQKRILKKKWYVRISRKDSQYIVETYTAGSVFNKMKMIYWKLIIYDDGQVEIESPSEFKNE